MTAEDLRKSILQQAIQGKLVAQDLTDEPASVLLERIREEKARLVKEKKIKKDKNESIIYRGEDNSYYEKFADGTIKCIDEEIPFEIPSTWEWVRLAEVSIIQEGPGIRSFQYKEDGVQLLTVTNILEGSVDLCKSKKHISESEYLEKYQHFQLNNGDIVCACSGGSWGKSAMYEDATGYKIILNTSTLRLRFYGDIAYNDYLYYVTKSHMFKQQLSAQLSGMQPNFGYAHYSKILIPVPPHSEQLRIVKRIKWLWDKTELYGLVKNRLNNLEDGILAELKKSILQYAIQGKLVPQNPDDEPASELLKRIEEEKNCLVREGKIKRDKNASYIFKGEDNKYYEKIGNKVSDITDEIPYELPTNWEFVRLSALCWLDDGIKSVGEKLPYLDAKFHRGKGEVVYMTSGKLIIPPCKVILVDGENSGEIFNVSERGYLGSTFKVLQISPCISEEWLHILLMNYRELFKNSKVGAAIPHLNKNLFRNLIVGIPPLSEQAKIASRIRQVYKSIEG